MGFCFGGVCYICTHCARSAQTFPEDDNSVVTSGSNLDTANSPMFATSNQHLDAVILILVGIWMISVRVLEHVFACTLLQPFENVFR